MAVDRIYIYQTSPNQKSIITHKTKSDKASAYGIFNVEGTLKAASCLSDRAFKLFVRMNLHQDGHRYALSPAEIQKAIGMSDKRYREAVKELIEKGYLVQSEKHPGVFVFYEFPQRDDLLFGKHTKSKDNPAKSDRSSGEIGQITRRDWEDNPSISGGEIVHTITSHNTENSTNYSSCLPESEKEEYDAYLAWAEQAADCDDGLSGQQCQIDLDDEYLPF